MIRLTFAVLTLVLLLAPAVGWAEEAAAPTPKTSEPAAKLAEPAPDAPCPASSTLFMDALGAVGAKKPLDDLGLTDHTCHEPEQVDLEQLYVQAFVGKGNKDGEGLDITFGKWVTTFGAEVIDAPANLLYSRGLLFNYAIPFTHTGVKANYTFSPQASAYAAVVRGWDNFNDSNDSASFMVGGTLGTREEVCAGAPRAGLALNVSTGPEQKDNSRDYRTVVDLVGTYRWTEKLTQVVNFDYGAEENGAGTSAAHWSGIANYVTYCSADCLSGAVRAEWFRDSAGVRTGIQGNLYEITAGLTIQPLPKHATFKNFYVRPELRWDFADHDGAFGGGRDDPLAAGFDLIFKF